MNRKKKKNLLLKKVETENLLKYNYFQMCSYFSEKVKIINEINKKATLGA